MNDEKKQEAAHERYRMRRTMNGSLDILPHTTPHLDHVNFPNVVLQYEENLRTMKPHAIDLASYVNKLPFERILYLLRHHSDVYTFKGERYPDSIARAAAMLEIDTADLTVGSKENPIVLEESEEIPIYVSSESDDEEPFYQFL